MFDIIIVTMPVCLPEFWKRKVSILIALFFGCDIFSNIYYNFLYFIIINSLTFKLTVQLFLSSAPEST